MGEKPKRQVNFERGVQPGEPQKGKRAIRFRNRDTQHYRLLRALVLAPGQVLKAKAIVTEHGVFRLSPSLHDVRRSGAYIKRTHIKVDGEWQVAYKLEGVEASSEVAWAVEDIKQEAKLEKRKDEQDEETGKLF